MKKAESPSPHVLMQQLKDAKDRNRKLEAEVRVLLEQAGRRPRSLVLELAEALADAAEAAVVAAPSQVLGEGGKSKPTSRPPSGGNPAAMGAKKGLETSVGRAIAAYWSRRFNDWARPARPESAESVRCRTRECSRRDKRTPKRVKVGGSQIEFSHCPECGSELKAVS